MTLNFDAFLQRPEFFDWQTVFQEAIARRTNPQRHGDLAAWLKTVAQMPTANPSIIQLDQPAIKIGQRKDLNTLEHEQLLQCLQQLIPWRKGPYNLFGIEIDTEWRSDWKWQRLLPHIDNLHGRRVLDVGCGNGYHCWRMLGAGANYVLGIDPSMRFSVQHLAIQKYANESRFDLLPLGIEDMPNNMPLFDSVFSMGVLYHRRDPINHLQELKKLLIDNGQLILETLIVDNADNGILCPNERYAQMRNVWSIMTTDKIINLLNEAGFQDIQCVDQTVTSTEEQRQTNWMRFHSLTDFLNPNDRSQTIEGYPAPKRAIFIAKKPNH